MVGNLLEADRLGTGPAAHESARVLHWPVPGRVWAMDFAEPSLPGITGVVPPLDGRYPYLLAVRDLASATNCAGCQSQRPRRP